MISDRLKKIQEVTGLTNQEMADRLFVSVSMVEKMRAGARRIRPDIAATLERIYHEERRTNGIDT